MTTTSNRRTARRSADVAFKAPDVKAPVGARRGRKPGTQTELVPAEPEHPRPTHHNGVAIVSEQRIPAPVGGFFKMSRIALADGVTAHACWECTFTADGRGEIMSHRNAEHGARIGRNAKTGTPKARDADLLDLVLPDREDGSRPGDRPVDWTIGEIIAIMPSIKALGDHLDNLERENEQLKEDLKQNRVSRADQHKIDVYESHQAEIGELRAKFSRYGTYETLKAEVIELRAWKKKITTKLAAVGFQLSEEDE